MIRTILMLPLVLMLSGCAGALNVMTTPMKRTELNLTLPTPLELRAVKWTVIVVDDVPYFSVDGKNYEKLAKNIEDSQNRLYLQHVIIMKQKEFYELTK